MKSVLVGGILGGIVIFMWGMVSWMVLPWHKDTLNGFKDEKSVAAVVTANITNSGMYIMPITHVDSTDMQPNQTRIFASVNTEPMKPMGTAMIINVVNQIIAAIFVAFMLSKTNGLGYLRRVGFVVLFAISAALVVNVPYWNWFAFDTNYTLVCISDLIIGWLLAGLVIAKFYKR